ncbi:CBS domain-containing protein [Rhizobiales bacterium L72]|uniref:CBS domain-containing protein n=2 Tax=Propylenella binzhouense TaxID=2555902 RepID=A0A964T1G9_9HYPH|nr:CBS domain-containing protein [Propylenella binzhouense]
MSRGLDPVSPTATVQAAALQMAEDDVGAVLVGSGERLEGILTDRDIILRLVVEGRSPAEVSVREVMSSTLFTCRPEDPLELVFDQMLERQVRRIPVLGPDDKPVGIVTLRDLVRLAPDSPRSAEMLRAYAGARRAEPAAEAPDRPADED